MNVEMYRSKLNELKGQRNQISKLLNEEVERNSKLSQDILDAELASDIIYEVAKDTQKRLSFRIENMVNSAMEYAMDNPYSFYMDWDISNNSTQCNLLYLRNGQPLDPLKDGEGTGADIVSTALRFALWSLPEKKSSPLFILDENFKHVSKGMRANATSFLSKMCDSMGIQIITISHNSDTIDSADKVFKIKMENNRSEVSDGL